MRSGLTNKMVTNFSSVSPIDDAVVWSGQETTAAEIQQTMRRAQAAAKSWSRRDVAERVKIVRRFADVLDMRRQEIAELITREVGKVPWDAAGEVGAAIAKVELSIQALQERRSEQSVESDSVTRTIRYAPLGVTLVLGPFNFPLHLPGGQIIPALLAGNSVVFKPSDQATAVGIFIAEAWKQAGLPEDVLQVIVGGVKPAVAAIDAPETSAVFLTGGRSAGRAIHRQLSGRPEVLLALELGGNNPIVIEKDVDPESCGRVVSFSAFISSGQRCTCARRAIFIESENTDRQIESLLETTRSLGVGLPGEPSTHIGPLISADAADSLHKTYRQLVRYGCKPRLPWWIDVRRSNLVFPTILDASDLDDADYAKVSELEWFGPMLVLRRTGDLASAIELAADTPYGLAASLLGGDRRSFDQFARNVGAGVVNWNRPTTGAAGTLPFGGLGDSGNHRPAGFFAIDFCNAPVASLELQQPESADPWSIAK